MWPEIENHKKQCGLFTYTCNSCHHTIKTSYHCTICDDFDLCTKCYSRYGHPHKMKKLAYNPHGRATECSTKNDKPDGAYGAYGLFIYTCNSCSQTIETCYHCTVCDDFDLCIKCYSRCGHPHKMEKLDCNLGRATECSNGDNSDQGIMTSSIQRSVQRLEHASRCRDAKCHSQSCQGMKRIITHYQNCKCSSHIFFRHLKIFQYIEICSI